MPSVARLAVSVTASSAAFSRGMLRASASVKKFGATARRTSGMTKALNASMLTLAKFAGAAVIARGFFNLIRQQEMFTRALLQSQAIMGRLSDQMRGDMRQAAIELARTTVFTAEQGAKAFFFLASAGLSAAQSLKALPLVGKFAQAGMFDLSLATDLLTDARSALGFKSKDAALNLLNMTRVSYVLVKANTLANASVLQFSQALTTKAGAALKVLGKDIEEGVAVLAAFADQGIKAADAGTALNIVLRDLSTKAIRNAKAFRDAGIAVFDSAGEMRNLGAIVGDLERALEGMSDAQAKLTLLTLGFADKSVIFIQTLLGMSDAIKEYEASLRSAGQTTQNVSDVILTPLQERMNEMKAAISGTAEGLGFFNIMAQQAVERVTELANLANKTPNLFNTLLGGPNPSQLAARENRRVQDLLHRFGLDRAGDEFNRRAAINARVNAKQRKSRELALRSGSFAEPTTDLAALSAFVKKVGRAQQALADFGVPPLVLQLQKLRQAFIENQESIPVGVWLEGVTAIEQLMKAQKRLEQQTRLANKAAQESADVERRRVLLFEQTRTPLERYTKAVLRLKDLQSRTLLLGGDETFRRQMKRLRQELEDALGGSERRRGLEIRSLGLVAIGGRQQGTPSKPQVIRSPQLQTLIETGRRTNQLLETPPVAIAG